ncbi:MAG: exodeoxyribonuclease VII small subunit [Candidatus Krumholzibacteriia bacterium]
MAEKKPKGPRELSFGEAVAEVEAILGRLEEDDVDIDDLAGEVKRAVELIQVCRRKLERTDTEVRELVAQLEDQAPETSAGDAAATPDPAIDAGAAGGAAPGETPAGVDQDEDLPF